MCQVADDPVHLLPACPSRAGSLPVAQYLAASHQLWPLADQPQVDAGQAPLSLAVDDPVHRPLAAVRPALESQVRNRRALQLLLENPQAYTPAHPSLRVRHPAPQFQAGRNPADMRPALTAQSLQGVTLL